MDRPGSRGEGEDSHPRAADAAGSDTGPWCRNSPDEEVTDHGSHAEEGYNLEVLAGRSRRPGADIPDGPAESESGIAREVARRARLGSRRLSARWTERDMSVSGDVHRPCKSRGHP